MYIGSRVPSKAFEINLTTNYIPRCVVAWKIFPSAVFLVQDAILLDGFLAHIRGNITGLFLRERFLAGRLPTIPRRFRKGKFLRDHGGEIEFLGYALGLATWTIGAVFWYNGERELFPFSLFVVYIFRSLVFAPGRRTGHRAFNSAGGWDDGTRDYCSFSGIR